jgi:hypothetical protein
MGKSLMEVLGGLVGDQAPFMTNTKINDYHYDI